MSQPTGTSRRVFATPGFWKPKPYIHGGVPTLDELKDFLNALLPRVSIPTFDLFEDLARTPPAERLASALQLTLGLLSTNTAPIEETTQSSVIFMRVLTAEERASFLEIAGIPELTQLQRRTAEDLLCLRDRGVLAFFLTHAFLSLQNTPYVREMD
jgi:hypothetical protein